MKALVKYKIGLVAFAVLAVGLLIAVVSLSSGYRQDQETNESAVAIADDLNAYISRENKVPEMLSEATAQDIPEQITYTNNSDGTYTFCVSYSSGENGGSLDATSILFQGLSGPSASYDYESSYKPRSLYLSSYSWDKGENCYNIEPYIYESRFDDDYDTYDSGGSDGFDTGNYNYVCETDYEYYELYKDYCTDGVYQFNIN